MSEEERSQFYRLDTLRKKQARLKDAGQQLSDAEVHELGSLLESVAASLQRARQKVYSKPPSSTTPASPMVEAQHELEASPSGTLQGESLDDWMTVCFRYHSEGFVLILCRRHQLYSEGQWAKRSMTSPALTVFVLMSCAHVETYSHGKRQSATR